MRKLFYLIFVLLIVGIHGCGSVGNRLSNDYPEVVDMTVENPSDAMRLDETLMLNLNDIRVEAPDFNPYAFVVICDGMEAVSQSIDRNNDGEADAVAVLLDLEPASKKSLTMRYAKEGAKLREYSKRTQAELSIKVGGQWDGNKYVGGEFQNIDYLRVPDAHTDHSSYIRYEGPGWESDRVGYRFYLDWRNAADIFGKKTTAMVLQNVGQDGFDSYHDMSDWGMDVLKVGESLGIGSIAMWYDGSANRVNETDSLICEIVANGPVASMIRTHYFGWKVGGKSFDLVSDLSICAGSRMTKHELSIEGVPENLCTGIVKHPDAKLFQSETSEGWEYVATYGVQSLASDRLGMAVLFRNEDLIKVTEDEHSHVAVLKADGGSLIYYSLAAWQLEPQGIKNEASFLEYLNETVTRLNDPSKINIER